MAETQPVDVQSIAARYETVRERVEQACQRVGRQADAITIVGVTKTFPLEVVEAGYEVGLRHFGENRARELRDKAREHPGRFNGGDFDWHMIGHLQTNKAKFIARHADWFDALDSPRLAEELDKRAAKNDRVLPCLVHARGEPNHQGDATVAGGKARGVDPVEDPEDVQLPTGVHGGGVGQEGQIDVHEISPLVRACAAPARGRR